MELLKIAIVSVALAVTASCVDDLGDTAQEVTTTPSISTDMSSYGPSQSIAVTWSNSPGNPYDFVAIMPAGSPDQSAPIDWSYTDGQIGASHVFGPIPIGSYEARLYAGDGAYTVLASAGFSVATVSSAAITTDASTYVFMQPITVSWTGSPGNDDDFVALMPAGSPAQSPPTDWSYTNGQVDGMRTFSSIPVGSYEARLYLGDGSYSVLASHTFGVSATAPHIATDATTYSDSQSIIVSWTSSPGNASDFVAIMPAGAPAQSPPIDWSYTNGQIDGSVAFQPIAVGNYEARLYLGDGTYTVIASQNFNVAVNAATIATDAATYTTSDMITVMWTGSPGNTYDFIAIMPAGAPAQSPPIDWAYTNGQADGSRTFSPIASGDYEVRLYLGNGFYTVIAMQTFSVN